MNKFKKVFAVVSLLVSGAGGVMHESLENKAHAYCYGSYNCCYGWGSTCPNECCYGQTQRW